jgi:hypothetical protein
MRFDSKYFDNFKYTKEQIKDNIDNALKDLSIAKKDSIIEVKFDYSYKALIKAGIALASFYGRKIKSLPGHHVKIIEMIAGELKDDSVDDIGNVMRSKRNTDFYGGGIEITEKESREYLEFVSSVVGKINRIICDGIS